MKSRRGSLPGPAFDHAGRSPDLLQDPEALLEIKPKIPLDEAENRLSVRQAAPPFRKARLEKIELVFIPHYLFHLTVDWQGAKERIALAADAILGAPALWRSEQLELTRIESEEPPGRNLGPPFSPVAPPLPFLLTREQAREKMLAEHKWFLIAAALKLKKTFRIEDDKPGPRLHYPFWAGYYKTRGRERRWNFQVIDAVTGERQGGKVRDALIKAWLVQKASSVKAKDAQTGAPHSLNPA